jgi:hypothetical protein
LRFNENISYADFDLAIKVIAKEALILSIKKEKKDIIRLIANGGVYYKVKASNYSIIIKKETIIAASL